MHQYTLTCAKHSVKLPEQTFFIQIILLTSSSKTAGCSSSLCRYVVLRHVTQLLAARVLPGVCLTFMLLICCKYMMLTYSQSAGIFKRAFSQSPAHVAHRTTNKGQQGPQEGLHKQRVNPLLASPQQACNQDLRPSPNPF
jgi:hypothetical protein